MEDDLDQLREQSARSSAVYEDVEGFEAEETGGFLSQFSSSQRLILAVLLLIDVLVVAYVILALAGIV